MRTWLLLSAGILLTGCTQNVSLPPVELPSTGGIDPFVARLVTSLVAEVRKTPTDADAHAELALAYEANEIWGPGARSFDNAHRINPAEPLWPYHSHLCRKKLGDTGNALTLLTGYYGQFPRFAPLAFELGRAHLEAGNLPSARQAIERSLELRPASPEALAELASIAIVEGDPGEALRLADRALTLDPGYLSARNARGLALRSLGRAGEAIVDLEAGIGAPKRAMPDKASNRLGQLRVGVGAKVNLAADLMEAGRPQDAERVLRQVQQVQPDDVNVLNNLALSIQAQRAGTEALNLLNRARRLRPEYYPTLINLGDCLVRLQRYEEALRLADEAVSVDSESSRGRFIRARSLLGLNRLAEGLEELEQAVALSPDNPNFVAAAGEVAMQLGRRVDAERHMSRAVQLRPDFIPSRVNLAILLGYRRAFDAADAHLQYLLDRVPEHPRVINLAKRLLEMRRTPVPDGGDGR